MPNELVPVSTVIVDMYQQASAVPVTTTDGHGYNGLRIHALPGLHDFVATKIREYFTPGISVLDMAAGSGAMSLRLRDMGYFVTATDIVVDNFKLHESIPFIVANLNDLFSQKYQQKFDAIVAVEIIEHLENPRNFIRECANLLKPKGRLILTTPNIDSPTSKALFARSGTFIWHGDVEYRSDGHITPLTQWQLDKICGEIGVSFLWKGSFGDADNVIAGSPRLRILSRLIRLISSQDKNMRGAVFVAVMEKSK